MLLNLAKTKQPFTIIVLPLLAIALWFSPLMKPFSGLYFQEGTMPLYNLLFGFVYKSLFIEKSVNATLLLITSFMINRLNTKFIFIPERTYMPAILYLIIISGFLPLATLSPLLPVAIIFLLAVERVLDSYRSDSLSYNFFDAGLLIGIASLIDIRAIFLIIFVWLALLSIRPFYWREWIFTFLGVAVPFLMTISIYFISDKSIIGLWLNIKTIISAKFLIKTHPYILVFGITTGIIILIASQHILRVLSSMKIFARRAFNLMLFLFLFVVILFILLPSSSFDLIIIAAIPVSLLFSHYFMTARKTKVLEIVFLVFVASMFVSLLLR